eukprot:s1898_g2.t1
MVSIGRTCGTMCGPCAPQIYAKKTAETAKDGLFSSERKDAKKLAVKKQRAIKKLKQAEKKKEESLTKEVKDVTQKKTASESEVASTSSKLKSAEGKLAEEKQSEDALQGALNKLEPKMIQRQKFSFSTSLAGNGNSDSLEGQLDVG